MAALGLGLVLVTSFGASLSLDPAHGSSLFLAPPQGPVSGNLGSSGPGFQFALLNAPPVSSAPSISPQPGVAQPLPATAPSVGTWVNLSSTLGAQPSGREGSAFAFNPAAKAAVLFGGVMKSGHLLNDTWLFHDGLWANVTGTTGPNPPARGFGSMTYDPKIGGMLLYGGLEAAGLPRSTWSFTNGTWTNLTASAGAPPPGSEAPLLTYDPRDGYDVLYGGSGNAWTWVYTDHSWKNLSGSVTGTPPGMNGGGGAFDPGLDAVLLYIPETNGSVGGTSQSYAYANFTWTHLTSASLPESHFSAAVTADAALGGTLLFGGKDNYLGLPLNYTWAFLQGNWVNETVKGAPAPSDRSGCVAAFDPYEGGDIVFGGFSSGGTSDRGETWLYQTEPFPSVAVRASPRLVEAGEAVTFFAAPFGSGSPPYTYSWNFGDGFIATGQNVTHTFSSAGKFTAEVTIVDEYARSNSSLVQVVVDPDPIVRTSASLYTTEVGAPVVFQSNLTYGFSPFTYGWSFGDGTTATTANAVHTFTVPGSFSVELVVTDSAGITTRSSLPLRVTSGLLALFGPTHFAGDVNMALAFNSTVMGGVPPYKTFWEFGDGGIGSGPNLTHVYAAPGNYTVRLSVFDSFGVETVVTEVEHVNPAVAVALLPDVSATDVGTPIRFTGAPVWGTAPYLLLWAFGDGGLAAGAGPSHVYTRTGSYRVNLTATDSLGGLTSASVLVTVNPLPSLRPSAPLALVPVGQSLQFEAAPSGGTAPYAIQWTFGDGSTAAGGIANHSYANNGSFTATATLTDAVGWVAYTSVKVDVLPSPIVRGGPTPVVQPANSPEFWLVLTMVISTIAGATCAALAFISWRRRPPSKVYDPPGTEAGEAPEGSQGSSQVGPSSLH